jgi:hypothetical protein
MLVVHTLQSVDDFDGRSTTTVTHGLAKLISLTDSSNLARVQSLWNALLVRTAMHLKSDTLNAVEVSNLLWAYAKTVQTHKRLLDTLANNAMRQVENFSPQGLSNVAWSFAKMNHEAPVLFDVIATRAQECIDEFNPQDLSNIAWAYATLKHEAPALLDGVASRALECINEFNPQELSNLAWAYAKMNHEVPSLLMVLQQVHKTPFMSSTHRILAIWHGHMRR